MNSASDVTTADRAAAAPRAATPAPPRASLASARAELFARTFAVWRLRAETGQGAGASDALSATAADGAATAAARDTARHDAARTEDAHRAWRDMISQAAAPPQTTPGADLSAAFAMSSAKTSSMRPRDDDAQALERDAAAASDAATRRHDAGDRDVAASSHDAGTLDPALRDRLDRVMARMEQAGHTLTITETSRTQARQDALYAQGRTAPGPVVTWTRQSRHLDGLAVDVQVDGSWNSPEGYALLGKVAKEEGLSTLGARDPGHLELRVEDALSSLDQMASIKEAHVSVEEGGSRTARVAALATVARVAQPASIARVATVAAPAVPSASAIPNRPHTPATDASSLLAQGRAVHAPTATAAELTASPLMIGGNAVGALAAAANTAASGTSDGAFGQAPRGPRAMAGLMRAAGVTGVTGVTGARGAAPLSTASVLAGAMGTSMGTALGAPLDGSAAVLGMRGATSALRADQVASLLEARDRQPVSSMLLTVDDEAGGVDRIRVDVRGARVGAEMLFGAAGDATQAATRVSELARALEQRGLAPDALKVANAAAGTTTDFARAAAPASERGHTTASRPDDGGRTPQDQPRHRSRREQGDHR